MRYRLTFTVNDNSEEAAFTEKQAKFIRDYGYDPFNTIQNFVICQGCDIAKALNQNPNKSKYSFYKAEILED